MDWQTVASWGMVLLAGVLLLRRLPWFARRRVAGGGACGGCHGCSAVGPSRSPQPLVQLGISSGRRPEV